MGCDIHAMVEMRFTYRHGSSHWVSGGRIKIDRNYRLFAQLANVRNYLNDVTPVSEPRFTEEQLKTAREDDWYDVCSEDFCALFTKWGVDGHSHSWVTLEELSKIDLDLAEKCEAVVKAHGFAPATARLVFFFDN